MSAWSFSDINRINQFNFSKGGPSLSFIPLYESDVFVKVTGIRVSYLTAKPPRCVSPLNATFHAILQKKKKKNPPFPQAKTARTSLFKHMGLNLNLYRIDFWSPKRVASTCVQTINPVINQIFSALTVSEKKKKSNRRLLAFITYWRQHRAKCSFPGEEVKKNSNYIFALIICVIRRFRLF